MFYVYVLSPLTGQSFIFISAFSVCAVFVKLKYLLFFFQQYPLIC